MKANAARFHPGRNPVDAGAAVLVCRSAGRAGAGLVTLAVPESLQPLFASRVVEATTMSLPEDDVEDLLRRADRNMYLAKAERRLNQAAG